jgi:hypothetical protein
MKFRLVVLFYFSFICFTNAENVADTARTELLIQLKERGDLFKDYSESLTKKSGFFGNRTKSDMSESQQKLVAIISADNKIMSTLRRTLDYRNFEKLNLSYDASSYEDRIKNISALNDALNKQNAVLDEDCKTYRMTIKRHQIYFFLLISMLVLSGAILYRKIFRK